MNERVSCECAALSKLLENQLVSHVIMITQEQGKLDKKQLHEGGKVSDYNLMWMSRWHERMFVTKHAIEVIRREKWVD